MGTLAKLVGTPNEHVTRAAIKLEEKGFIIREQDSINRRVVNIFLSEKAKEIVRNTEYKYLQEIKKQFDDIPIEQMRELKKSADYVLKILNKINDK